MTVCHAEFFSAYVGEFVLLEANHAIALFSIPQPPDRAFFLPLPLRSLYPVS